MATIQDKIDAIEALSDYVANSLFLKSFDECGVVFKWLKDKGDGTADRQQKFFGTDTDDKEKPIPQRTVVSDVYVNNPS